MKKIAENYYRFKESHCLNGLNIEMEVDKIDGEELDTTVSVSGNFAIGGAQRKEFISRLDNLIAEYNI